MSPRLAVLVPSRGRPSNLLRLVTAVTVTTEPGTPIWVRVDDDDSHLEDYRRLALAWDRVTLVVGPRVGFVGSVNELAALCKAEYFAVLGDDVVPESKGWDRLLIDSLGGKIGVAYGSDGLEDKHGVDLPTHVVIPRDIYDALGWIALPDLEHLFVDNVWRELGKAVHNFRYVPEAKLTHLHPWAGKAVRDSTYAYGNDPKRRARDRRTFEHWNSGRKIVDVAKLKDWVTT